MSDSIRRASGISDDAPVFRKGITAAEVDRHAWHRTANTGPLDYTYAQLEELGHLPAGVEEWIDSWTRGNERKGLLLTGSPGTGKTTLLKAVIHEVIDRASSRHLGRAPDVIPAWPVYYQPYSMLIRDLGRRMTLDKMGDYDEEFQRLNRTLASVMGETTEPKWVMRLVALDDVGQEYLGKLGSDSWAAGFINTIMRARDEQGLTTLATSNYPRAKWGEVYGEAAGSFAHQAFYEVSMRGKDYRRG